VKTSLEKVKTATLIRRLLQAGLASALWAVVSLAGGSPASAACDVDPAGTYVEAENSTGTIVQGSGVFAAETVEAGFLGTGYLLASGGAGGSCPAVDEGREYRMNFPTAGTYNVWIRAFAADEGSDSVFIGLDGNCAGALDTNGVFGAWTWSAGVESGQAVVTVTTPGTHSLNVWVREGGLKLDGIYLDTAGATPNDTAYGLTIDPVNDCGAFETSITRCDQCHPMPPVDTADRAVPEGGVVGSHQAHSGIGLACEACHGDTTSGRTDIGHRNGLIEVASPLDGEAGAAYSKGTAFDQVNDLTGSGLGSCDGLTCHSIIQTDTGGALTGQAGEYKQPAWGGSVVCGDCHAQSPTSGSHGVHLNAAAQCGDCHQGAGTGAAPPPSAHGNRYIDVKSALNYSQGPQDTPGTGFGDCSNLVCHGSSTVTWGGSGSCDMCHNYPPTLGAHGVHVNPANIDPLTDRYAATNTECGKCHTVSTPSNHANGQTDVEVDPAYSLDGNLPVYDHATKTCTNVSCHYRNMMWFCSGDQNESCLLCHGMPPTTGSHTTHDQQGALCGDCHDGAVKSLTPPANHKDGTVEIYDQNPGDLGWDGSTCSTASCHGNTFTTVQTPPWGTSYSGCDMCHEITPTTGAHGSHLAQGAACGDCHNGAVEAVTPPTNGHRNGTPEADLNGYNTTTGQCSNASCHTTGQDEGGLTASIPITPNWYTSPSCGECHDAVPDTGSHFHVGISNAYAGGTPIVCGDCHPGAGDGSTQPPSNHQNDSIDLVTTVNYSQGAVHPVLNGYGTCQGTQCHAEWRDWGGGESPGGLFCGNCHRNLRVMADNTAGMVYKHLINAGTGYDPSYPTLSQPAVLGDETDTNRRCLVCHVDHDVFSAKYGGSGRSNNLRPNVTDTPSAGTETNTDYDAADPYGGLCLSCHSVVQTKAVATPNGVTKTPPIPYPDQTDASKAPANGVAVVDGATHSYEALSTSFSDGTRFRGVCVKCHNDSMEKPKQGAEPGFAVHQSSRNSFFAVMGTANYKDFNRAVITDISGTTVTLDLDLVKDYSGYYALVVGEDTNNTSQRSTIVATSFSGPAGTDTVTVDMWPVFTPSIGDTVEITREFTPIEEVCFNCHSQGPGDGDIPAGEGYKPADGTDYYQSVSMQNRLEKIRSLFIGFGNGTVDSFRQFKVGKEEFTTICDEDLAGSWPPDGSNWIGYTLRMKSGRSAGRRARIVDAGSAGNPDCSGGEQNWVQVAAKKYLVAAQDRYDILKPAVHPLDFFGLHEPGEFETASASRPGDAIEAWNSGDMGVCSNDVDGTHCRDADYDDVAMVYVPRKTWVPGAFAGLELRFVSGDCQGRGVFTITDNTADTLYFDTGAYCTPAEGDQYVVGTRHVSCADCHNTHAAEVNPSGETSGVIQAATWVSASEIHDDDKTLDRTGWPNDKWKDALLVVTDWQTEERQVRQIVSSTTDATGTSYVVGIPFTAPLPTEFVYEIERMNGDTGSGGRGVWGVEITGQTTAGQDPSTFTYTKYFDTGREAAVGSGNGKQYMQCMRCHSYYGFADAYPNSPSGDANDTPTSQTDVAQEINPNNYAHHAIMAVGKNQPIPPDGTAAPAAALNPNWPVFQTTATVTDGVAVLGASLPETVLPGWYMRLGTTASDPWYQIVFVQSATQVTIAATNGNPWDPAAVSTGISYSGTVQVTAGLGNAFLPPYGPWDMNRCTECHGSTVTDPLGPHASVNKWLIRDADTNIKFQWWDGSQVVWIDYTAVPDDQGGTYPVEKRYICFNCHRADVYGPKALVMQNRRPANENLSRLSHGDMWAEDGQNIRYDGFDVGTKGTYWPQYCRNCHAGDRLGGIHGTWNAGSSDIGPLGKRFLNGASWNEYHPNSGGCYTIADKNNVSACKQHPGGNKSNNFQFSFNYDYTN